MNHTEFLEKQWIRYEKVCKEKNFPAGTKEAFIERQTPKRFTNDDFLVGAEREEKKHDLMPPPSPIKVTADILETVGVEAIPLFKIKRCDEYILTHDQLVEYLTKAYEAGRQSA